MEKAAERTADVIRGIGVLIAKIKTIPGFNSDFGVLYDISYLSLLENLGKADALKPKPFTTPMTISGSTDAATKEARARAKAEAEAARRQKELLAAQKKSALAEKNKLSLSKAAAVFDTNRISIAAALRATYDKDTILRLEALQAIEDDNGELALKKITELGLLQKATDAEKLAGITKISGATLEALNTQLLNELKVINSSKMAESEKEAARQIAFGKYNAAIAAAGDLAAKESYSERVQIQLTEIAKLASLSNTFNAAITLDKIRESAELSMIDRVAAAQKKADDARLKALQEYAAALGKVGSSGVASDPITKDTDGNNSGITPGDTIDPISKDDALTVSTDVLIEAVEAATERANAFALLTEMANDAAELAFETSSLNTATSALDLESIARTSFLAGLSGGAGVAGAASGSRYAAQAARYYNININAGAISSKDEFTALLQETIQKINRDGDPLTVAGTI